MSIIRPDSRLTPELIEHYRSTGAWRERTLGSYLDDALRAYPDKQAAVGYDVRGGKLHTLTYRELDELADRLATGLLGLGVQPGDAVSIMLPNWVEFAALMFAIARIGAIYSGIPAAYGQREATFMVRRVKSKVMVVPHVYRNRDYVELARQIKGETPDLTHVIVLGDAPADDGFLSFSELESSLLLDALPEVLPGSLVHVGFTSGTTGEPKGVMNTHQTLDAVLFRFIDHHGTELLNDNLVNLIASPMGHHTGFLWGVLFTTLLHGRGVYLEHWDRDVAARIIDQEGVTWMPGAPTFLQDLLQAGLGPGSFNMYAMAGSPIPRSLPREAGSALNAFICPAWGMTEWGIGICGSQRLPRDRVDVTDGMAIKGCEARVMADPVREAAPGEEGDLQIRGGGLFLGYFDRPDFTADAFVDGWFQTGDRAIKWEDGFISLSGRSKDIIIRGGENVPVVEIETLIYQHPDVLDVAVVGYPDERLGERACAVLVCRPPLTIDVPGLSEFLLSQGMSKHFLPERIELLQSLPKTTSGKIKKAELRQWLVEGGEPPR